jgi:uncharacterized protein YbjT (DUF2867 family)
MSMDHRSLVLLTGASGYIGGRLLKALEAAGRPVRCLARRPEFLVSRVSSATEVVQADCLDRTSLALAFEGVDTAYYLVHSMGSAGHFEDEDRQAARNFADASREQGVRRIIYLGGLETRVKRYPHTCGVAMRWRTSCEVPGFRPSNSAPRS